MSEPLTKSYVDATDPEHPLQDNLVLYELFERAREKGVVGEIVNLETNERVSTTEILDKADGYAKGMLALGLIPGEDTFAVIGCPTLEAVNLFTACSAIGIAFAHPYIYTPMDVSITSILSHMEPKIVVVGEGASGKICTSFLEMFDESELTPEQEKLPFIKHIFYDTYQDRKPAHWCICPLSQLIELGKSVPDEKFKTAKASVKPEYRLHHLFSSGSTGKPKCIAHSHYSLANELLQLRAENVEPMLTMNPNIDEMISYSCAAWVLAGKVSKCVYIPDIKEDVPLSDTAKVITKGVIDEGVQYLMIPGSVSTMIRSCILNEGIQFPPIKFFLNGSQIVSRGFKENLKECFQGMALTAYGMTETFIIATTLLLDTEKEEEARMQARLTVKPNTQLRIADSDDNPVDIGKDGMVQVKTYSRLKEYRGQQRQLINALFTEDGYVKTGDMGMMYEDGTFIIKGRMADAIRFKVLGDVIYPGPIEEVMSQHPAIEDISVIAGSANDYYGDELTYCIKLKTNVKRPTEEELIAYGTTHELDETQRPCRLMFMEELCYTDNSRKVSKARLRESVQEMIKKDSAIGLCDWYKEFITSLSSQ